MLTSDKWEVEILKKTLPITNTYVGQYIQIEE